jgi:hypothetical protein
MSRPAVTMNPAIVEKIVATAKALKIGLKSTSKIPLATAYGISGERPGSKRRTRGRLRDSMKAQQRSSRALLPQSDGTPGVGSFTRPLGRCGDTVDR